MDDGIDPKQRDFGEPDDGVSPVDGRPSLHLDTIPSHTGMPQQQRQDSSKSLPMQTKEFMEGNTPTGTPTKPRKSVQLPRKESNTSGPLPRKSTATARGGVRQSRDFDVRRDGPYGRPSLAMSRRRSSAVALGRPSMAAGEEAEGEPVAPTLAEIEASEEQVGFEPEPPALNYSLWKRKWFILLFWGLILIDVVAQPIALYFGLWYGTDLSPNIVFSIITACLGGVSIFEYVVRFWRLWKKDSTCRVIGARRMYLDWFHWNFSLGWIIIMVELIVGTVPENPPIRLLAMPIATMLFVFGTELLIVDTLRYFNVPSPIRMSSIPKGAQLRPAIYAIIEDVVAVDGSGGTAFREALNRRYEASHVFRAMLRRLGGFWAFGCEAMAIVLTILIFTLPGFAGGEAAYCIGWGAPFIWAAVWTLATYLYVKKKLKEEKKAWADEIAEKQGAIALQNTASE